MFRSILVSAFAFLGVASAILPTLEVSGFSWAENLAFDGLGSMFVSDVSTGEIARIYLCGEEYCKTTHISDGIDSGGGLAVSPDGAVLYAGVTLSGKSKAVIRTSTTPTADGSENTWEVVAETSHKPNGMSADWSADTLYCTHEGMAPDDVGGVFTVNVASSATGVLTEDIEGADGCWFDPASSMLYVGKLMTMEVWAYDVKNNQVVGLFPAASSLRKVAHMLDDITLQQNQTNSGDIGKTLFYGADFTGKQIISFSLDGSTVNVVAMDNALDLQTPTSVRFGKGNGFCSQSIYVTEGGGLTERQKGKRVVQISLE